MAKVVEENLVITVSKLIPNNSEIEADFLKNDQLEQIQEVITELIDDSSLIVEVNKVKE